jgi:hypothetical protein
MYSGEKNPVSEDQADEPKDEGSEVGGEAKQLTKAETLAVVLQNIASSKDPEVAAEWLDVYEKIPATLEAPSYCLGAVGAVVLFSVCVCEGIHAYSGKAHVGADLAPEQNAKAAEGKATTSDVQKASHTATEDVAPARSSIEIKDAGFHGVMMALVVVGTLLVCVAFRGRTP